MTASSALLYSKDHNTQITRTKTCRDCGRCLSLSCFEKRGLMRRPACNECRGIVVDDSNVVNSYILSDTKRCAKCKAVKPISEFTKVSDNPNGLHSYCKDCIHALGRMKASTKAETKRKALRVEYENMAPGFRPLPKICGSANCHLVGELQPPENFDKSKIHNTGLRIDCRLCELERKRSDPEEASKDYHNRWYQEHKEELNKRTKEWREANPEHVKEKYIQRRFRQYGVTQEWYDKTIAAQGGMCAICGSTDPKSNGDTFHIDHNHNCCSNGCNSCGKCVRGFFVLYAIHGLD